jgi:hypothetical protein
MQQGLRNCRNGMTIDTNRGLEKISIPLMHFSGFESIRVVGLVITLKEDTANAEAPTQKSLRTSST